MFIKDITNSLNTGVEKTPKVSSFFRTRRFHSAHIQNKAKTDYYFPVDGEPQRGGLRVPKLPVIRELG